MTSSLETLYLHPMSTTHNLKRFNVRVYGILINGDEVLVADEVFKNGGRATKFPGGGLELGEGLREGLVREFLEEAEIEIIVGEHLYTTDFFQPSFFDNESQIISVYYLCNSEMYAHIKTSTIKYNFDVKDGEEAESLRWVKLSELANEPDITLPIDVVVVKLLRERLGF